MADIEPTDEIVVQEVVEEEEETSSFNKPLRKIEWEEILEHTTQESLWVVVHNKVYDVTKFMEEVSMLMYVS
jgi:cytochrome b involved in lipid metabolism